MHSRIKKIYLGVIVIAFILIYIYAYGNFDSFFPIHLSRFYEVAITGDYVAGSVFEEQMSGLYTIYGGIISIITGITTIEGFSVVPWMFLAYIIVCYSIFYLLSKNHLISGVLVCMFCMCYALLSSELLFWIHSIGVILYLSYFLLILLFFIKKITFGNLCVLTSICLVSLALISYDYLIIWAIAVAVFGLIAYSQFLVERIRKGQFHTPPSIIHYVSLLIILGFAIVTLNRAFLFTSGPNYLSEFGSISRILEYIIRVFNGTELTTMDIFYVNDTPLVTATNLLRLLLTVVIFGLYIILVYKLYGKNIVGNPRSWVIFSISSSLILYFIIRVAIGSESALAKIPIIGILCLAHMQYIYKHHIKSILHNSKHVRICKSALNVILILFIISLVAYFGVYVNEIGLEKKESNINDLSYTDISTWLDSYTIQDSFVYADVWSRGNVVLSRVTNGDYQRAAMQHNFVLDVGEVLYLLNRVDNLYQNTFSAKSYVLLNYGVTTPSIGENWRRLYSWDHYDLEIDSNKNVNVVYSSGSKIMLCLLANDDYHHRLSDI